MLLPDPLRWFTRWLRPNAELPGLVNFVFLIFFVWTCRLAGLPLLVGIRPSPEDYIWVRAGMTDALNALRQLRSSP